MPSGLTSQEVRITTGLLNTVNDALPGATVSSGTGQSSYSGQLGAKVVLGPDEVGYSSAIGTLYGGVYQYVRFKSGATAAPALGLIAFWDTGVAENLYQVTNDEPTGVSLIAGITLSAVTKGNYGFIQTWGRATVKFRAAITKTTPAIGDLVICAAQGAGADVATADVLADATALLSTTARSILGIAEVAPSNGAASIVRLKAIDMHV